MIYKNKIILLFSIILFMSLFGAVLFAASDANTCDTNQVIGSGACSIDVNLPSADTLFTNNSPKLTNSEIGDLVCGVYFTKLGCPHCAKVDPVLLGETVRNKDIFIIEYEVGDKQINGQQIIPYVTGGYNSNYNVPQLILNQKDVFFFEEITSKFSDYLEKNQGFGNICPLPTDIYSKGDVNSLQDLKINELSGLPTVWYKDRALFKTGVSEVSDENLYKLLTDENVDPILHSSYHKMLSDTSIEISYGKIKFDNAVELKGYNFYWNGKTTISASCETQDINLDVNTDQNCTTTIGSNTNQKKISLWTVVSLALIDAVNPCEFAVLILLLLTIMTTNVGKRRKVLYSGLMFTLAIFLLYFVYGLFLVNIFKLIPGVDIIRIVIYKVIAAFALFLAFMQLKDYFNYRPGTIGTEMPMSFRPKVQRLISKVTSPSGAFIVGVVVSLFLLPCTIGPYVILGNLLSYGSLLAALPVLLLYNVIFILPMLAITLIIYFGVTEVQKVGEWKQKNIKYFHLIAGIILFILGILMLFGII